MSDLSTLIINELTQKLKVLEETGVGFIDQSDTKGILYKIDGRYFDIRITEMGKEEDGTLKRK